MRAIEADRMRDRFRGCMVGLAVGDALGMPVETLTREEILAATGGRGVEGYLAPLQTRFHSTAVLKPGQWTDDTQLSLAIARSLVRKHGFDLADIVAEHGVEYQRGRRGWGKSTTIGVRELLEGKRMAGEPVRDPKAIGLGNGVAMKIAPLALYALSVGQSPHHNFSDDIRAIGQLTHRDRCASDAASMIWFTIFCTIDRDREYRSAVDVLGIADLWRPLLQLNAAIGGHSSCVEHPDQPLLQKVGVMLGCATVEELTAAVGNSCSIFESIPFVLGVVRLRGGSFRSGVLAAVNAGGDTDSNGAMVGAILGAHHGMSAIPHEWIDGLEAHDEIIALADQLFDLAMSR